MLHCMACLICRGIQVAYVLSLYVDVCPTYYRLELTKAPLNYATNTFTTLVPISMDFSPEPYPLNVQFNASNDVVNDEMYNKVLTSVKENGYTLRYVHEDLKSDYNIVLAAVQQQGWALPYASPDLQKNCNIVEAAVKQNGEVLYVVHPDMEKNYNIVEAAVKQNGLALKNAHYDMKNDFNIVMAAVKQDGMALQFAHDDMKRNYNVVMAAVKQDGMALQYSHKNLKKNYNIVEEAVKQNGYALQYANDDMRKNYDIVEAAVKQNGRALQYAHDDFKRNYNIVEAAVKQSLHALQYAHESSIIRNQVVSPIILKALKDDPDGRLVFHALVGDKTKANIIKILVKADRSFVDLMDDDGSRAIDRAVPDCKLAIELALCLFEKFDVLSDTPIIHKSPTACVFKALDKTNESFVALKCINNHHQVRRCLQCQQFVAVVYE